MNSNQAAANLADRKELPGDVQNDRLIGGREQGRGSHTRQKPIGYTILQGTAGSVS